MAFPQGNFSYQRAYPPDYGQDYPPPIGFQNYMGVDPNVQPNFSNHPQNISPYPPTNLAYGAAELENRPKTDREPLDNVPEVGFERFSGRSNQPSAQSASGVELENVEGFPDRSSKSDYNQREELSDNSATRIEVLNYLVLRLCVC